MLLFVIFADDSLIGNQRGLSFERNIYGKNFYKWYQEKNMDSFPYLIIPQDTSKIWYVNYDSVKTYFDKLRSSSYLADEFFPPLYGYIKKCDSLMQVQHLKDGIPDGFEFDLILCAQDMKWGYDVVLNGKYNVVINNNTAQVGIEGSKFHNFALKKVKNKWLISRNGCI